MKLLEAHIATISVLEAAEVLRAILNRLRNFSSNALGVLRVFLLPRSRSLGIDGMNNRRPAVL